MKVDFLPAALRYAEMGWPVFPLGANSKLPAIKGGHGVKDATTDHGQIRDWAKSFPYANIGLACGKPSGFFVIDIDPRNGGERSIATLIAKGLSFPPCPTARTGGGGTHLFFRLDPRITNSKNRLGPGIDVKSTGGYVVGAPSRVLQQDGIEGRYEWVRNGHLMAPPSWLIQKLLPPPPRPMPQSSAVAATGDVRSLLRFIETAPEGERNKRLYWSACRVGEMIRANKVSKDGAERLLLASAAAVGLQGPEAVRTIASGLDGNAALLGRVQR